MRSRTTSTSSERGVKMLRRWASKNMGWLQVLAGGGDGGVEALEVAGLDDAVVLCALSQGC